jgi:hypothetical protein
MATKLLTLGLAAVMTARSRSISSMSPTSSGRREDVPPAQPDALGPSRLEV